MKSIITIVGPDRVGIIAEVCTLLAELHINVIDISQTIMHGMFAMIMFVEQVDGSPALSVRAQFILPPFSLPMPRRVCPLSVSTAMRCRTATK